MAYENEASRGMIINLGYGKDISMNFLLQNICNYMGYDGEWDHREERTSDVRNLCAGIERARTVLGFAPEMNFEEGIRKTLDWYTDRWSKEKL